jgi:hypothetical protein
VKIIIFKVLIVSTIFVVVLKQNTFRIQQSLKLIDNNFCKFIKKFCFVFDKHKHRVCTEKLGKEENCFVFFFNIKLVFINKIMLFQTNVSVKLRGIPFQINVFIEFKGKPLQNNMSVEFKRHTSSNQCICKL